MASIGEPLPRTFRSANTRWIAVVSVFVGVLFFADAALFFSSRDDRIPSAHLSGILDSILGVVWIVLAVLWTRRRVTTSETSVVLHNGPRNRFILWNDISGFCFGSEIQDPSLFERTLTPKRTPYVVLRDGRRVRMNGLSALTVSEAETTIQGCLNELEHLRRYFTRGG